MAPEKADSRENSSTIYARFFRQLTERIPQGFNLGEPSLKNLKSLKLQVCHGKVRMADEELKIGRWSVTGEMLAGMTPAKARDALVDCFFHAQMETYRCVKKVRGEETTDEAVLAAVKDGVMMAFREVGGDFEAPTRDKLIQAVEFMAKMAPVWGTPEHIVERHKGEMMKVLDALE